MVDILRKITNLFSKHFVEWDSNVESWVCSKCGSVVGLKDVNYCESCGVKFCHQDQIMF